MQAMHGRAKAAGVPAGGTRRLPRSGTAPQQRRLSRLEAPPWPRQLASGRPQNRDLCSLAPPGMYEYGASPEQMHYVPHVPPGTPELENTWQRAWRAIKVPELLALIESSTHSAFEDTSLMQK